MNIVHVAEPFAGGIIPFLKSLVENMPDDRHIIIHGERAHVISLQEAKKQFRKSNVRFIHWQSAQRSLHPRKDLAAFFELHAILKRLQHGNLVDAVHLHSSKSGFLGRLACRVLGIRNVVYTPNGAPFLVGSNRVSNYMYKQLEKLAASFGGQVVCCSQSEQSAYAKAGIRAVTINNGIAPRRAVGTLSKEIAKDKFIIATSGRIIHQKNPSLFNNIARYFEEFSQFRFVWVGDGPDRHQLSASNITITGWQSAEQVAAYINQADVYLSTAHFEGLPFAVLEALSLRKPVLLTDCVGNRDLVKSNLNGNLFRSDREAIVKILQYHNNAHMLSVMGNHSVQHCEESFNVNKMFAGYRDLYLNVYHSLYDSIVRHPLNLSNR